MSLKSNPYTKFFLLILGAVVIGVLFLSSGDKEDDNRQESQPRQGTSEPERTSAEDVLALGAALEEVSRSAEENEERTQRFEQKIIELTEALASAGDSNNPSQDREQLLAEVRQIVEEQLEVNLLEGSIDPAEATNVDDVSVNRVPRETRNQNNTPAEGRSPFETAFNIGDGPPGSTEGSGNEEVHWVFPVGYEAEDESVLDTLRSSNPFASAKFVRGQGDSQNAEGEEPAPQPYVTIPPDTWMFDATALTALVGRIERDGVNHSPWDFDVVLSGDVSIANGHNLPEIQDARASGVAVGDQAASCIRGYVTSLTFVFADGRVYNKTGSMQEPIAKIGDEYGNPCVPGEYYSNTKELIGAHGLVAGVQSVARSIEQRQQTVQSTATSQNVSLTGSAGKAAAGAFGAGGAEKLGEVVAQQYEAYYPFVYAPAGQTLSLRFRQSVDIDYSEQNRKVRYEDNFGYSWP